MHQHTDTSSAQCANCSASLAGNYCQNCGQKAHIHRSVGHIFEELLHGMLHFDSKAWHTLPALIIHPGQLTRDYIDGKRTRYISPLFLFLFLNLVMFVSLSYLGGNLTHDKTYKSYIKGGVVNELNNTKIKLDELNSKHLSLAADDKNLASMTKEIELLQKKQVTLEKSMDVLLADQEIESEQDKNVGTANSQTLQEKIISLALQNPDLVLYKMKGVASKFAFILIPISLPFLWLLFLRRKDIVLFDHCIFSLYSLSFMCLLIIAAAGFVRFGFAGLAWLLLLIVSPIHMFAQLRGTYQLSITSAVWRTLTLLMIACFSLCVYFVVITWFSL